VYNQAKTDVNNASAATLHARLLGSPRFFCAGEPVRELRIQKAQALLVYLVVESLLHPGQDVAREKLTDLFWPGMPLESALQNLRQTLYQVRKAVPTAGKAALLGADRKTVWLHPDLTVTTDLDPLLKPGSAPNAGPPPGGVFLENFYVPDCDAYEEWIGRVRHLVRERQLQALQGWAETRLAAGEAPEAAATARQLVELEPLSETGHWLLIQALGAQGQRAEALQVYQRYAHRLRQELGTRPGITPGQVQALLEGGPAGPPAPQPGRRPDGPAVPAVPTVPPTAAAPRRGRRAWLGAGAVAGLALALLLWAWYARRGNGAEVSPAAAPSIAVLPFANYSNQDYLADGLADDLVTQLSYVPHLRVVPGLSSLQYRTGTQSARQIGAELNVTYLLKGSVQKTNGQVKVNVQLIHAPSNRQQWAQSVVRPAGQVFAVGRDLVEEIAAALRISPGADGENGPEPLPTQHQQAYEAFLQGRFQLYQGPPGGLYAALAHFRRAVALDPGFVGAREYIAHTLVELGGGWGDQSILDVYPQVETILRQTQDRPFYRDIRYDTEAWLRLWLYQPGLAEPYFRRAIAANPNSEWGLPSLAQCLNFEGKFAEAIRVGQRATASNPISLYSRQTLAIAYMLAGRYGEAHEHGQKALALNPFHVHSVKILAQNYTLQGKPGEAVALLTRALREEQIEDRDPYLLGRLAVAYARQGDRQAAGRVQQTLLEEYGKKRRHFDYFIAMTYQGLGETEKALDWLEISCDNLEGELNWVQEDPEFAGLRDHPRYRALLRRMNTRHRFPAG
jgi:DNA-binding SARP family transcriptional activator/TolB-like protein